MLRFREQIMSEFYIFASHVLLIHFTFGGSIVHFLEVLENVDSVNVLNWSQIEAKVHC